MSLTPRLTLIGLYKYDANLFINLSLPEDIDSDIFIDSLLLEYGECPLIYTDLDFMKLAIGAWSRKWYDSIVRINTALSAEYNPIHNYDRTETWTENESGNRDYTKGTSGNSELQEDENTELEENENGNNESLVSAYNENDYQPSNKDIYERDKTNTIDRSKSNTIVNTENESFNENNGRQNTKTGRTYGNIGVTESSTMVNNEIELRKNQNIYHIISEMFYREFCIYVF